MPKQESISRVQEPARKQVRDLNGFDYNAPAELFPIPSKTHTGNLKYKRFDTAAEALRFAVEEIPAPALMGAFLEVDEARFGAQEIRYLYENAAYPLTRPTIYPACAGRNPLEGRPRMAATLNIDAFRLLCPLQQGTTCAGKL